MLVSSFSTLWVLATIWMAILSIAENSWTTSKRSVSAFTTTPNRQHYENRPLQIHFEGCPFSCRAASAPTLLHATRMRESAAAPVATTNDSSTPPIEDHHQPDLLTIVPPNQGFRTTEPSGRTEVSIASMNLLAPFYNSLQLPTKTTSDYERWEFLDTDRRIRVPEAIRMAKQTNADVLCLQEIEGGKLGETGAAQGKEFTLREDIQAWLAASTTITTADGETLVVEGYDSFVWSPLNPNNKRGDVVGLCIAWRSQKHSLVEWEGYRRGMVCRLRVASCNPNDNDNSHDDEPTASFAIANLHLPARPSNVLGRLNTMSKTIRKLSDLDKAMQQDRPRSSRHNTIDGLLVVAGDFNSDQDSVAARLLSHGYTNYGNVRDRNYKAKVTKASATHMSHPYRFLDSYDHGHQDSDTKDPRFRRGSFRDLYAPVTVSLKGRGPGIMDHLFYATGIKGGSKPHQLRKKPVAARRTNPSQVALQSAGASTKKSLSASVLQEHLGGKRSKRRKKGETRGGGGSLGTASAAHYSNNSKGARVRVEAVLATVEDPQATNGETSGTAERRWNIIQDGLPNLQEGFPSDHLPVGVLFAAIQDPTNSQANTLGTLDTATAASSSTKITKEEEVGVNENSLPTPPDGERITREEVPSPTDGDANPAPDNTTMEGAQNIHSGKPSGVSSSVQRRRKSSRASFGLRRRHNVVLNTMTEWLVGRGATSVVLDKPLYKNELLARTLGPNLIKNLKKKSRAPDLMCVVVNDSNSSGDECLVVLEVAVASDPEKVRAQKTSKYKDLVDLLSSSISGKSCRLATIVVRDDGQIPEGTISDIQLLAQLTSGKNDSENEIQVETRSLCSLLETKVSSFRIDGK